MTSEQIEVVHNPASRRFLAEVDGSQARLDYELGANLMRITHTRVPPDIGGRGVAGAMMRAAAEHARSGGLKIEPACSYAAGWLDRHPQYADLRTGETPG